MGRYLRIWKQLAVMGFKIQTGHPLSSSGYLLGKSARIVFFLVFLAAVYQHVPALAGYSFKEAALFFLTFNLVDMLAQLFFRGIYGIRALIREGDFDYFLIQPTNVLFRCAFNTVDFLDVVTIVPLFAGLIYVLQDMSVQDPARVGLYAILCLNAMIIALAIHIAVASIAVLTQEMENSIWIYRDLMTLGRFPVDIYGPAMRRVLTFIVPIAVMISFPVKAFLGKLEWYWLWQAILVALGGLWLSLVFWRYSVRRYTSVSS